MSRCGMPKNCIGVRRRIDSDEDEKAMAEGADLTWPDKRLVDECLKGNDQAWGVLVDKYKNLVFSAVRF